MKKLLLIAVILILVIGISVPLINDYTAIPVARELSEMDLPPQTELIESISSAGKLVGSGNGMQYFGAMLIKSELSIEELEDYYSQYRKNQWSYIVEEQNGSEIKIVEHRKLEFKELRDIYDLDKYYIVYSWGESKYALADMDIRGH